MHFNPQNYYTLLYFSEKAMDEDISSFTSLDPDDTGLSTAGAGRTGSTLDPDSRKRNKRPNKITHKRVRGEPSEKKTKG